MNQANLAELQREALSRAPSLESLSKSQIEAIRRIPSHEQARIPSIDVTRPATIFTDSARFALEQERIFKKMPVPLIPSARLPAPNSTLAFDSYGVPLLITRGKDGKVQAFLNACQHKGSRLLERDCEVRQGSKLVCPYHAWTFGLDGRLVGVPRAETFANLDKDARGLAELPCHEAGGIIWGILDKNATPDFSRVHPQIVEDFDAMAMADLHLYGHKSFDLKANWKVVLEPFLEGYHVQRLHSESIGNLFADVPNVTHMFGDHIRQISGKANYTPDMLTAPGENIHKLVTHAYQLFPNGVVVTSPYYISLMVLAPHAANRTIVDYYFLVRGAATTEKVEALYKKSYEMVLDVFGGEDYWAAEQSQEGLESGAIENVVYCGMEETIPLYYNNLERYL